MLWGPQFKGSIAHQRKSHSLHSNHVMSWNNGCLCRNLPKHPLQNSSIVLKTDGVEGQESLSGRCFRSKDFPTYFGYFLWLPIQQPCQLPIDPWIPGPGPSNSTALLCEGKSHPLSAPPAPPRGGRLLPLFFISRTLYEKSNEKLQQNPNIKQKWYRVNFSKVDWGTSSILAQPLMLT